MTGQTPTTNEDDGETNAIATLDDRRRYDTIRYDTTRRVTRFHASNANARSRKNVTWCENVIGWKEDGKEIGTRRKARDRA